jgi:putative aldouronate transport system substrate-binding protein
MNPILRRFRALPDRWVDDGEGNLVYGGVYPGMKDALTLLAKWYKDGLSSPNSSPAKTRGGYWACPFPLTRARFGSPSTGAYYTSGPRL